MMAKRSHQTPGLSIILPDKRRLSVTVGFTCRGHEVMNQLSQLLGVKDLRLFGLCLERSGQDLLFLDLEEKLSTYFSKAQKNIVLRLKVRHYMRNGRPILEENGLSLYRADLMGRVLNSRCYGQEGQFFQLAAYALQAELGDWREREEPYFDPCDYFPPWILEGRGSDYVLQHTPGLHRELQGTSACDASLLFIEEACSLGDVPLTLYSMSKGKKEQRGNVLLGLALSGVHVYEVVNGDQQLLYELAWSSIDRLTYQGRRFEIRANAVSDSTLVLYTCSALHSRHLLKHMSNNHRVHLDSKHSARPQTAGGQRTREMYIKDLNDPDTDDSEDELPPIKICLDKARRHPCDSVDALSGLNMSGRWNVTGFTLADSEIELCVDEPTEVSVDDLEEIINLSDLPEDVDIVDNPSTLMVSPWIGNRSPWTDVTVEMKQVLKKRTNRLSALEIV